MHVTSLSLNCSLGCLLIATITCSDGEYRKQCTGQDTQDQQIPNHNSYRLCVLVTSLTISQFTFALVRVSNHEHKCYLRAKAKTSYMTFASFSHFEKSGPIFTQSNELKLLNFCMLYAKSQGNGREKRPKPIYFPVFSYFHSLAAHPIPPQLVPTFFSFIFFRTFS